MKKLMLALCLASLGVACRASGANMHDSSCSGPDCAECTKEAMEDCSDCTGAKAECSAEAKAECSGDAAQVCPVTGKSMN
jgi:hypothetical protein